MYPLFLLVSIAVTTINHCSACFIDLHVGQINLGQFGAAHAFQYSGLSVTSIPISCSIVDQLSASPSLLVAFGSYKSKFQSSQFSGSAMLSDGLSSSLLAGLALIL